MLWLAGQYQVSTYPSRHSLQIIDRRQGMLVLLHWLCSRGRARISRLFCKRPESNILSFSGHVRSLLHIILLFILLFFLKNNFLKMWTFSALRLYKNRRNGPVGCSLPTHEKEYVNCLQQCLEDREHQKMSLSVLHQASQSLTLGQGGLPAPVRNPHGFFDSLLTTQRGTAFVCWDTSF